MRQMGDESTIAQVHPRKLCEAFVAAAIGDDTADASVGNVTGSNAVNVFLGIGVAWTFAAFYWAGQEDGPGGLEVKEGTLTFSVVVFCVEAMCAIAVLLF